MAKKKKSKCSDSCKKCMDDDNTNNSNNCSDNDKDCMNRTNLNKSDR